MRIHFIAWLGVGLTVASLGPVRAAPVGKEKPSIQPNTVKEWIKQLKDPDPEVCERARENLFSLGPEDKKIVPILIEALPEKKIRSDICWALRAIGKDAVPALRKALEDNNPEVRIGVLMALGHIGRKVDEVIPTLIQALKDPNKEIRKQAIRSMQMAGPRAKTAVPSLCKMLAGRDENWYLILRALVRIGPAAQGAVPTLCKAMQDRFSGFRSDAAEALGAIGPGARAAIPTLIQALKDGYPTVRIKAALAIWRIEGRKKLAVVLPALVAELEDKIFYGSAASALGSIGPDARAAVPALIAVYKSPAIKDRASIASVLAEFGPDAKEAVPALIEALKTKDKILACEAAWALGAIGKEARAAVPALMKSLSDPTDSHLCCLATQALAKMGPDAKAAVPDLARLLKTGNNDIRSNAAATLGALGADAKAAVPALRAALQDSDETLRIETALALWRIDRRNDLSVRVLCKLLQQSYYSNKWHVVAILGDMGPDAKAARPRLKEALKDRDPAVRVRAAVALWRIEQRTRAPMALLIEALKDENYLDHAFVITTLEEMGPKAKVAVPALIQLWNGADVGIRWAIVKAMKKIDPAAATKAGIW
jgi:HEAT repeat protein